MGDGRQRMASLYDWNEKVVRQGDKRLTAGAGAVYCLLTFGSRGENAHPSMRTVAIKCGLSESTVKRHVTYFVQTGWVAKESRGRGKTAVFARSFPNHLRSAAALQPVSAGAPRAGSKSANSDPTAGSRASDKHDFLPRKSAAARAPAGNPAAPAEDGPAVSALLDLFLDLWPEVDDQALVVLQAELASKIDTVPGDRLEVAVRDLARKKVRINGHNVASFIESARLPRRKRAGKADQQVARQRSTEPPGIQRGLLRAEALTWEQKHDDALTPYWVDRWNGVHSSMEKEVYDEWRSAGRGAADSPREVDPDAWLAHIPQVDSEDTVLDEVGHW